MCFNVKRKLLRFILWYWAWEYVASKTKFKSHLTSLVQKGNNQPENYNISPCFPALIWGPEATHFNNKTSFTPGLSAISPEPDMKTIAPSDRFDPENLSPRFCELFNRIYLHHFTSVCKITTVVSFCKQLTEEETQHVRLNHRRRHVSFVANEPWLRLVASGLWYAGVGGKLKKPL